MYKINKVGEISYSQLVLTSPYRLKVICRVHESVCSGHFDSTRLSLVKAQILWPDIFQNVESYISSCECCEHQTQRRVCGGVVNVSVVDCVSHVASRQLRMMSSGMEYDSNLISVLDQPSTDHV